MRIKRFSYKNKAAKPTYLSELQTRITNTPTHLLTFQTFINFCQSVS